MSNGGIILKSQHLVNTQERSGIPRQPGRPAEPKRPPRIPEDPPRTPREPSIRPKDPTEIPTRRPGKLNDQR